MSQQYKCTVGEEKASFASRSEALAEGWCFVTAESQEKLKYHVLCPEHASTDWVRKALNPDARKGSSK